MPITTADIVKLRKMTGAGMMDCKNALTESEGDFDRAITIIRERGKLVASKRADREASEGAVLAKVSEDKKFGAIVVLNCETDFVAKNEKFLAFTNLILDAAIATQPANLEELKSIKIDGRPIGDQVMEQIGIIGEKLDLSFYGKIQAGCVACYVHPGNRLATIVGFSKPDVEHQLGKDVAMQVTAMNPVAVNRESVPQDVIDKELEIAKEKFRLEGKPEAMLDKIAQGALQKFFQESTLLEQAFIKENKITVKQYIAQNDKNLTVTGFERYALDA